MGSGKIQILPLSDEYWMARSGSCQFHRVSRWAEMSSYGARSGSCHIQWVEEWQDFDLATFNVKKDGKIQLDLAIYYWLKCGKIWILPLSMGWTMARSRSCQFLWVEEWQDPDLAIFRGVFIGKIWILPLSKGVETGWKVKLWGWGVARSRSCHLQCVEKWQDPDLATYYGLKNGKIRILPLTKSLKTPDPMGSGKIRISPSDFNRYVEYGIMKGGKIQVILFCFFKVARSRSCHFFCLKVARSMARIIFKLSTYISCISEYIHIYYYIYLILLIISNVWLDM